MKLPRVNRIRKGGRLYRYHRVTGGKLPADLPEDHPSFIAAWAAEEAKAPPKPQRGETGSITAAIEAFLQSDRWLALSQSYRGPLRGHFDAIRKAYGSAPFARLEARHVSADLAKLAPHPARHRRKAWRMLCGWAVEAQLIPADPSEGVKAKPTPKTKGYLPWTADEIEAFRARWPVEHPRRLAFELTFWTGANIAEVVRFNRGMIGRDGVLDYTRGKTGAEGRVPWSCALPPFADRETHRLLMTCLKVQRPALMFVQTQTGAPRSVKAFGQWLSESARLAEITGKSAHGLRKNRAMDLAERGAGPLALMSWCAWLSLKEAQHYITAAERRKAIMGTERKRNSANRPGPAAKNGKN